MQPFANGLCPVRLQTRSFQYVSDLVDGLVALMNGNFSDPVNIGNPDEYTMLQFAEKIRKVRSVSTHVFFSSKVVARSFQRSLCNRVIGVAQPNRSTFLRAVQLTNSTSEIVYKPMPKDDPSRRRPDITRAKKEIGWQPVVTVDEGLRKAIL
jgi:UDP-glucuronate decarboxylase